MVNLAWLKLSSTCDQQESDNQSLQDHPTIGGHQNSPKRSTVDCKKTTSKVEPYDKQSQKNWKNQPCRHPWKKYLMGTSHAPLRTIVQTPENFFFRSHSFILINTKMCISHKETNYNIIIWLRIRSTGFQKRQYSHSWHAWESYSSLHRKHHIRIVKKPSYLLECGRRLRIQPQPWPTQKPKRAMVYS